MPVPSLSEGFALVSYSTESLESLLRVASDDYDDLTIALQPALRGLRAGLDLLDAGLVSLELDAASSQATPEACHD